MASVKDVDFFVLVPSEDGSDIVLASGSFTEDCEYVMGDLKKYVKNGFEFCAHVLVPKTNMFQRFGASGELEDFLHTGLYWASVWQNRKTKKTVYGLLDAPMLRSERMYAMIEKGYMGMATGFNFSRVTSVSGMSWHTGLKFATKKENDPVWVVTIDGTAHGEYEKAASSCLFGSLEAAKKFVVDSLYDDIVNTCFQGENPSDGELDKAYAEHCKWFGEDQAQLRYQNVITDYKIEKMSVHEEEEKA